MADKETSRVEAFSDGVFAIAITLLILEIKVPNIDNFSSGELLYKALIKLWPSYFAFAMSFAAILIMWINHHGFFNYLKKIDARFLFANGFMLLLVTFIPFPTAILAKYIDSASVNAAASFYCGTMVLISIAYNLLWYTSAYKRRLIKPIISNFLINKIKKAYWYGFLIYLLAFIISIFYAYIGLIICISLWILWSFLDYSKTKKGKNIIKSNNQ
ncbi:MAG: TMEM175 family protein [Bacteroidetes bacterium]|nr:TMEM175 family protein [Bacteroidota bacterium]